MLGLQLGGDRIDASPTGFAPFGFFAIAQLPKILLNFCRTFYGSHNHQTITKRAAQGGSFSNGRNDWIRTSDPQSPRLVRYQTALRSDTKKQGFG